MDTSDLPPAQGERYVLAAEEELRLEVPFSRGTTCQLLLQQGSCELQGAELVTGKPVIIADDGGLKIAFFTWHGCVIDIESEHVEIAYTSDETNSNVAIVNSHAQLEVLRDEAAAAGTEGPRVLIVGPTESGKSNLAKVLIAYATKLGRTPIAVDLDPADNGLSVPGSLAAVPMTREAVTPQSYSTGGLPAGTASPLVMWHGSLQPQPDLFKAQVTALGQKIHARLQADEWARSSGIIVNTNGWIEDEGYQLLVHTVQAFQISVVLVVGHDRLYSMMKTHTAKQDGGSGTVKVIKVPRSGGVVSRDANFLRQSRSRSLKRYFYGDMMDAQQTQTTPAATPSPNSSRVPQLTPFLLQLPFKQLTIYKFSSISLSASLLPVASAQATEAVQFVTVEITDKLQHAVLAVCHPHAVASYEKSGRSADLYADGVAGFCAVERVMTETEMVHLLSPCAGSLPSNTLILGDITWME
jgi:polyribonucleotide 5'-hydroxyl-kinase